MDFDEKNIGVKYNKLTIVSFAGKTKDKRILVNCLCECGNNKVCHLYKVIVGRNKSCGCLSKEISSCRVGEKYNRLTITIEDLGRQGNARICEAKCDCGNKIITLATCIKRGKTKSCGCLSVESARNPSPDKKYYRKYEPKIASARLAYRGYNDGNITFEKFLELSQLDCYYCKCPPSNVQRLLKSSHYSDKSVAESIFIYSGLDRINSEKLHDSDNVVPCCKYCNFAKNNYDFDDFCNWIKFSFENLRNKNLL